MWVLMTCLMWLTGDCYHLAYVLIVDAWNTKVWKIIWASMHMVLRVNYGWLCDNSLLFIQIKLWACDLIGAIKMRKKGL